MKRNWNIEVTQDELGPKIWTVEIIDTKGHSLGVHRSNFLEDLLHSASVLIYRDNQELNSKSEKGDSTTDPLEVVSKVVGAIDEGLSMLKKFVDRVK